jgi:hypothetical protein
MLRVVKRTFEADHGRVLLPGDIVDVSTWKHHKSLKENGYLGDTDAKKFTVDVSIPPEEEGKDQVTSTASASPRKAKTPARNTVRKSALASRARVFTRKA